MNSLQTAPEWTFRYHWMSQIAGHAQSRPHEVALRYRGNDTTWLDLHTHSLAFAGALRSRGIGEGDRVLVLALNRPEFVEVVFGINSIGAIAVPVNFRLTPAEILYIAHDSGARAIVFEEVLAPLVQAVIPQCPHLSLPIVIGSAPDALAYQDLIGEPPIDLPDISEEATALIMYTSGTTGSPKGAMLSHRNLFLQAMTVIRANGIADDSDIAFMTVPFFHIAGLGSIACNFVLGLKTVIHPLGAFDATETVDAWEAEGATSVFNVPQQWQAICAVPGIKERNLPLRIISWGAAPASETLLRTMSETFPHAMNIAVFGQTETSPITCVLRGDDSLRKIGSVGKPIPTIQTRIVDENMNDVPVGEAGEIIYRGPTVMRGYWNKPEETAAAFEGGWFHSGDVVRADDEGFIWVVDRMKDMIISGGENIYCVEIENLLYAHPKILDVAIVGRPDMRWGEVPVAFIVPQQGQQITLDEVTDFLAPSLARFKLPKEIMIVDQLPRNAGGKVVKPQLRALLTPLT